MWIITENERILKVSVAKENEEMIFVENCPVDLINEPTKYAYVNGAFMEIEPEVIS